MQLPSSAKRIDFRRFLILWALSSGIGFALSIRALGELYPTIAPLAPNAAQDVAAALFTLLGLLGLILASATIFALPQWLVIRQSRLRLRFWVAATVIGFFVGILASVALVNYWTYRQGFTDTRALAEASGDSLIATFVSLIAAIGLVLGASIGVAQWIIIRRRLRRSVWWVITAMLGFGLASALAFVLNGAIPQPIPLLVGGLVFGILTSVPLRYLMDYPSEEESTSSLAE